MKTLSALLIPMIFLFLPHFSLAQCAAGCPSNNTQCNNNADCCIVSLPGTSIADCISAGATILKVNTDASINSGDISGIQFCLGNSDLTVGENVTVNSSTCFDANGSFGVSVTIGGSTFTFEDNDGTLDELNAAIGNLGAGATIGAVVQSLPVTLRSFEAKSLDKTVLIEWTTGSESDNDYFLLEHSQDGKAFQMLSKLFSYGNSESDQFYTYEHQTPVSGTNYYRLWQYDLDGTFSNLGLTEVKQANGSNVQLFPNPAKAGSSIQIQGLTLDPGTNCTLYSLVGQKWNLRSTDQGYAIPTNLPAGLYFLQLTGTAESTSIPVQIQ
mgnify:CR=1 FL=1